jgi:hypothetical protein
VPEHLGNHLIRLGLKGNPEMSGSSSAGSSASSGLSAGAVAGICLGVVAALALAAAAAFLLLRRSRRNRGPQTAASDPKFAAFLDEEGACAPAGPSFAPRAAPATFYEAAPSPGSPHPAPGSQHPAASSQQASGGVELSQQASGSRA